jgi:hypothetical protein
LAATIVAETLCCIGVSWDRRHADTA